MKIAHVGQPWDRMLPSQGNITTSIAVIIVNSAKELQARGHEVLIYCPGERYSLRKQVEHADGITYQAMGMVRLENRANRVLNRFWPVTDPARPYYVSKLAHRLYAEQVARDLKTQNVDIVHLHNMFQFASPIRAANPNLKIVLHMHCEWLSQLDRDIIMDRIKGVDLVLGVSGHITGRILERLPYLGDRCRTVYEGASLAQFSANGHIAASDPSNQQIMFLGRVSPEKGVHVLIDAFPKIAAACPQARLDIVGPLGAAPLDFLVGLSKDPLVQDLTRFYDPTHMGHPTYEAYLMARIPEELKDRVTFTGPVPNHQVSEHYRRAALLASPSLSDAMPLPPLEAMVDGKPVVAAATGGLKEIVAHDETGFLVEPANADELADAIIRLLQDPELRFRMGQAARERVRRLFSWQSVVDKAEALYHELLSGKLAPATAPATGTSLGTQPLPVDEN